MIIKKDLIFLIACISIVIIQYILGAFIINTLELETNTLTIENELLKTELSDYNNTTEIFLNYCIKCYCKDICIEASNEMKTLKGEELK